MAKPFKLRYVNEVAGTFVLLSLLLVAAGVVLVGRAQHWFTPMHRLTLALPEQGSFGLERGANVLVLGTSAGNVTDISVGDDGRMIATVAVREDFTRFIRVDSLAVIRRTLGVGDAYVEIHRGTGAALPAVRPVIVAVADAGPTQAIDDLLAAVRAEVVPAVHEFRLGLDEYRKLAADMRDPDGPLQRSLVHLRDVTAQADAGNGLAGRLLRDRQFADDFGHALEKLNASADSTQQLVADLRQTSARLPKMADSVDAQVRELAALTTRSQETLAEAQAVLKDLRATTSQGPETLKTVNRTLRDLPALVMQADETLRQTQRLVEAMQRNWLISPYVQDQTPGRIRPGQAGGQ